MLYFLIHHNKATCECYHWIFTFLYLGPSTETVMRKYTLCHIWLLGNFLCRAETGRSRHIKQQAGAPLFINNEWGDILASDILLFAILTGHSPVIWMSFMSCILLLRAVLWRVQFVGVFPASFLPKIDKFSLCESVNWVLMGMPPWFWHFGIILWPNRQRLQAWQASLQTDRRE